MDFKKIAKNVEAGHRLLAKLDAFRKNFPISETFRISASDAVKFADEFSMTDDSTYGIAVGKTVVRDDDHLHELLGDDDEIAIEFRHVPPQEDQPAADVYRWLRQCEHQD